MHFDIRFRVPAFLILLALLYFNGSQAQAICICEKDPVDDAESGLIYVEPYLQYRGVNTEMTLISHSLKEANCEIRWGSDRSYSSGKKTLPRGFNEQKLTQLVPGEKYFYQLACQAGDKKEVRSGSFLAAPSMQAKSVKFLVYGDSRSRPDKHDRVAKLMVDTYTKDPGYQTFTLHSGDLVSCGGNEKYWHEELFTKKHLNIRRLMGDTSLLPCLGNHENRRCGSEIFDKYFPQAAGRQYYAFDYGPAHITVINSEIDFEKGSRQYKWIVKDLASSTKRWKFILMHRPAWSAGHHSNNKKIQDHLHPLFLKHGVSMVFNGHNHNYARAEVDGIYYVTAGGGGAPLYEPLKTMAHIKQVSKSYHFCKVEIAGDLLKFQTVETSKGKIIDTFQMKR